jgi:hypothetical protein
MVALVDVARPALEARGWKEVDWVNVSMALSYEGATQYDGLHVVGERHENVVSHGDAFALFLLLMRRRY